MTAPLITDQQRALLEKIGAAQNVTDQFYLSGGTALAGFYLHHRHSEDLDFFSESEFEVMLVNTFFQDIRKDFGITKIDFQQSFNRNLFFLHTDGEVLKTEFTYYPFPCIESGETHYGVTVDSLIDIAVNKVFTIYQQSRARDYIDLFFICREKQFTIKELTSLARAKFDQPLDSLQLGSQFVKAVEAKDYPRMVVKIPDREWQEFFLEEAKKLKGDILK